MNNEKITKINKFGKVGHIISKIILVFTIIGIVASGAISIAALCVPNDIATINVNGTAEIQIDEKYLEIGKTIIQDVDKGMTSKGQTLNINGAEFECVDIKTNGDQIDINYNSTGTKITVRNFSKMMAGVCLECINTLVLICFVIALCKSIKLCNSPFEENVIKKMQNLAIALIPWYLIQGVAQSISASAFTTKFDLNVGFDFSKVLVILIVIALINIFKYGAVLQQESDETL